ncbi:MAG: alpha/beta hydrolase [Nanoarchaeota archaeon]
MRIRTWFFLAFFFLILLFILFYDTGFLQKSQIDKRDLARWNYNNSLIEGNDMFILNGSKQSCWILIHGYTSTPDEMKELGEKINLEFGDYVVAPRLLGHSEVPSKVLNLSFNDWYWQLNTEFNSLSHDCKKINIVGSSLGGTIALNLAEEEQANNLYLVDLYLHAPYHFYYIFKPETSMRLLSNILHYIKKHKTSSINDPVGEKNHKAYLNFPLDPIVNSQKNIKQIEENLYKIDENTYIQHSINDDTSSVKSSKLVYEKIASKNKSIIFFSRSNHVLLRDYDKDEVINNIIKFERENR